MAAKRLVFPCRASYFALRFERTSISANSLAFFLCNMEDPVPQVIRPRVRLMSEDRQDGTQSEGTEELEQLRIDNIHSPTRDISDSDILSPDGMKVKNIELSVCSIRDEPYCPQISPMSSDEVEAQHIFNPFALRSNKSMHVRSLEILDSLNFHAVELVIECVGLARNEFFSNPQCFVAVFSEGVAPGQWQLLDKSEDMTGTSHMMFMKKFRLRAATALDRDERMLVAFFDRSTPKNKLDPMKGLGSAEFTVSQLLESKQMITEKNLRTGKQGSGVKGCVSLALEMVYHVEEDQSITLDIGFLEDAPLRNRMFFVISRALRRGKWSPIYRSEVRLRNDVEKFEPVTLGAQEFHGGDIAKLFRLEVHRAYKNGRTKLLGFMQTSCEKLASMETNGQLYWWPAREGITSAKVLIQYAEKKDNDVWYSLRMAGRT